MATIERRYYHERRIECEGQAAKDALLRPHVKKALTLDDEEARKIASTDPTRVKYSEVVYVPTDPEKFDLSIAQIKEIVDHRIFVMTYDKVATFIQDRADLDSPYGIIAHTDEEFVTPYFWNGHTLYAMDARDNHAFHCVGVAKQLSTIFGEDVLFSEGSRQLTQSARKVDAVVMLEMALDSATERHRLDTVKRVGEGDKEYSTFKIPGAWNPFCKVDEVIDLIPDALIGTTSVETYHNEHSEWHHNVFQCTVDSEISVQKPLIRYPTGIYFEADQLLKRLEQKPLEPRHIATCMKVSPVFACTVVLILAVAFEIIHSLPGLDQSKTPT